MADHLYVVTGGPGSGKSTLLSALAAQGIATVPESGRAIIQAEVAAGGHALPWDDRAAFAMRMMTHDVRAHAEASALAGPVMFDRGVPDVIGYLRLCGLPVPTEMWTAARRCRYHRRVLVAPPWPAIYVQDDERRQTPAEAEATCAIMRDVYGELGYELVSLPRAPVAERVAFARRHVSASVNEPRAARSRGVARPGADAPRGR